jgi:hypothetical protein
VSPQQLFNVLEARYRGHPDALAFMAAGAFGINARARAVSEVRSRPALSARKQRLRALEASRQAGAQS